MILTPRLSNHHRSREIILYLLGAVLGIQYVLRAFLLHFNIKSELSQHWYDHVPSNSMLLYGEDVIMNNKVVG